MSWLSKLVAWLRDAIGIESKPPAPLEILKNDLSTAHLLFSDVHGNTAVEGIVEIWLISHTTSIVNDLVLILLNIAQLRVREKYGSWETLTSEMLPEGWRRAFEVRAKTEIKMQKHIAASHLFMVGWLSKEPVASRVRDGRVERFRHVDCQKVYAFDLQGASIYLGSNVAARRILQAIVRKVLRVKPTSDFAWEEILRSLGREQGVTWVDWFRFYACQYLPTRIGESHVLQPPRSQPRGKNDAKTNRGRT